MEYGAIALHLKASLIRIVDANGAVVLDRRSATTRDGFTQVFGDRAPLRVLLESGPESEWVAQTLEACGHEVIVADPNYALMYGQRARRIKTDRRDVAALAEACRVGIYRAAHRLRLLRGMRLVRPRREGRQVFYALDDDHIIELLRQALTHVEDTWERFGDAGAATAFLGLVPREDSSGTRHRKGAITKAGPGPVRALLVQAAWVVWRQRQGRAAWHAWVERLAARRGRRIAVVALARRLARILFAVWRDETEYQAVPSAAAA